MFETKSRYFKFRGRENKGHELVTPAGMTRLLKVKTFYGDTKSVFNILSTAKGKCVQQENDIVLHIVSVFKGDF